MDLEAGFVVFREMKLIGSVSSARCVYAAEMVARYLVVSSLIANLSLVCTEVSS